MPHPSRILRLVVAAVVVVSAVGCGPDRNARLEQARAAQETGDHARSIPLLRAHLGDSPDDSEALYRLGMALLRTGHRGAAVWPLARAAEDASWRARAGLLLASTLLESGNFEAAITAADDVLAAADPPFEARILRARARLAHHEAAAALTDIEQALAGRPDDRGALTLRARALEADGHLAAAREAFEHFASMPAGRAPGDASASACLSLAAFLVRTERDAASTPERIRACLTATPGPAVLQAATALLDALERREEATALWRAAADRRPDDLAVATTLAGRLEQAGATDEAEARFREIAIHVDTATAWQLYAEHLRRRGRAEDARRAIEHASERAGDAGASQPLLFTQIDLSIDLGHLDEAEARLDDVEDDGLRELLRGRIALAHADPADALAALEVGIPLWPDNVGARLRAARAAEQLGDFERALEEYRAAFRANRDDPRPAVAVARLHLALGEPASARTLLEMALSGAGHDHTDTEIRLLLSHADLDLGDSEGASAVLAPLATRVVDRVDWLLARARIMAASNGESAAADLVEAEGADLGQPGNRALLHGLVEYRLAAGEPDRALTAVDARLAGDADADLWLLRGRILLAADRDGAAREAFENARAFEPTSGRARVGLAITAARAGRDEEARTQLERVVREDPGHARACADLARSLVGSDGDLARARALAERAV